MSDRPITPAQIFALVVIWSAVGYGVITKDVRTTSTAHAEAARRVACR